MAQKICPVCEKRLKIGNYCKTCKTWVTKPIIREENYNLNESHATDENNCEYHMRVGTEAGSATKESDLEKSMTRAAMDHGEPRKQGIGAMLKIFVVAAVLVAVIVILGRFINKFRDSDKDDYGEEVISDQEVWEYLELSEEEVIKQGMRCNGYDHFHVSGDEVVSLLTEEIPLYGYTIKTVEHTGNNQKSSDPQEDLKFYSSIYELQLEEEMENGETLKYMPWVTIDMDTVTKDIHSYSTYLSDPEAANALMQAFVSEIEHAYGIASQDSCVKEIEEMVNEALKKNQDFEWENELFQLFFVASGDAWQYLRINSNME